MHFDDPTWAELVERGKDLLGKQSGLQWDWGDLALEVEPMSERERGERGEFAGRTLERLAAWAEDIQFEEQTGRSFSTLRTYREVAARWPSPRRRGEAGWGIHSELAYVEDRFKQIKGVGTVAEARAIARGDYVPRDLGPGRSPLTRVAVRLSDARATLVTALDGIQIGHFNEDEEARQLLQSEVELVESAVGWIKSFLETGSVEEEFRDVLARIKGKSDA